MRFLLHPGMQTTHSVSWGHCPTFAIPMCLSGVRWTVSSYSILSCLICTAEAVLACSSSAPSFGHVTAAVAAVTSLCSCVSGTVAAEVHESCIHLTVHFLHLGCGWPVVVFRGSLDVLFSVLGVVAVVWFSEALPHVALYFGTSSLYAYAFFLAWFILFNLPPRFCSIFLRCCFSCFF